MSERERVEEPAGRGADPRQTDEDQYDEERAEHLAEHRPVTHDEPQTGQQGTSSDKPGVDGGGYPEEPGVPAD